MHKNRIVRNLVRGFERFTDHIIPWLVIALAVVLFLENPFWTLVHLDAYEPWVSVFDGVIVFFFVVDLSFKWVKTKNLRKFLKLYWLDIIAVFPFYLAFRAYAEVAGIFRLGEEVSETGQKLAHEAVLLREAKSLREAEEIVKEARISREARIAGSNVRAGQRFLRLLKGRLYDAHDVLFVAHRSHQRR